MNILKSKKGFTLIEMLVVIAIIAVLVSIIIPTVTSATDKASAATNAANLRSFKAEVTTKYLSGELGKPSAASGVYTEEELTAAKLTAPTSVKCNAVAKDVTATVTFNKADESFTVAFGTAKIENFADVAAGEEGATLPSVTAG